MATGRGENEGFHMLPEFVCDAIGEPGLFPPGTVFSRGEGEGFRMLDEFIVDLSEMDFDDPPPPDDTVDE